MNTNEKIQIYILILILALIIPLNSSSESLKISLGDIIGLTFIAGLIYYGNGEKQ